MALPYSSALQTSLACVQGLSLMVTTHNSTAALREGDITEDIFIFSSFRSKFFCIWPSDTKRPVFMSTIFLPLAFHPQEHTNPSILMDAKQWLRALLLLRIFGSCVYYNHWASKNIFLHQHPNDHHHYHNSYHTTHLPTSLWQTNQGHAPEKKSHLLLLFHTFLVA